MQAGSLPLRMKYSFVIFVGLLLPELFHKVAHYVIM